MAFLDIVGENLTKISNEVTNKTKTVVEQTSISTKLRAKEDALKKMYSDLGKKYYELHENDAVLDNNFAEFMSEIKSVSEEIEEYKNQIRAAKGVKLCNSCGTEVNIQAAFCSSCGAKFTVVEDNATDASDN